jgi:hypothetical protein
MHADEDSAAHYRSLTANPKVSPIPQFLPPSSPGGGTLLDDGPMLRMRILRGQDSRWFREEAWSRE